MAEPDCFASNTSLASNMAYEQQDKKDVSKLFALLRSKLNAKEKELLELQRAQSCLLAPDAEQINVLVNMISSLHLSTQDGCFLFPSTTTTTSNESSSTCTCSTGVDTIKTLPSTMWLPEPSVPVKEQEKKNEYRLPMVSHLFSLPMSAFVASSANRSPLPPVEAKSEPSHRLPMVSQLLSMPLNAFRSPSASNTQQMTDLPPAKIEATNNVPSSAESTKSIFQAEPTYSKEHWLRRSSSSDSEYEHIPLDLDAYIEQSSDKMRRLHTEYREAMEKLKMPSKTEDSTEMIKATYPHMFDRLHQDMSTNNLPHLFPSKK